MSIAEKLNEQVAHASDSGKYALFIIELRVLLLFEKECVVGSVCVPSDLGINLTCLSCLIPTRRAAKDIYLNSLLERLKERNKS